VGLAPGLKGANRTSRPFTGDYAGELLYASLKRHGLARGTYQARADDGFELVGARITNAVRCVPPENKPLPVEIGTCRRFLAAEIAAMPNLRAILALGGIAHNSVVSTLALKKKDHGFAHGDAVIIAERVQHGGAHAARRRGARHDHAVAMQLRQIAGHRGGKEARRFLLVDHQIFRPRRDLIDDVVAVAIAWRLGRLAAARILAPPAAGIPIVGAAHARGVDHGQLLLMRLVDQPLDVVNRHPALRAAGIAPALDG